MTLLVKAEVIKHTAKVVAILAYAIENTVRQGGLAGKNLQSDLANISVILQASQALKGQAPQQEATYGEPSTKPEL